MERITTEFPDSGILITFIQFAMVSLHGLFRHITFSGPQAFPDKRANSINNGQINQHHEAQHQAWSVRLPHFKPRRIPLLVYGVQVVLFYISSTLNNAVFAYHIPMTVFIVSRSGGLIVNMGLGWLIMNKKYVAWPRNVLSKRLIITQI